MAEADPKSPHWWELASCALQNGHSETVQKAWAAMDERFRRELLSEVFSFETLRASRAMLGCLGRLAGMDRLKTLAVSIIDDDRGDGDDSYLEAIDKVDALSEWLEDPAAWVRFCQSQPWEGHLMPRTSALQELLRQQAALAKPPASKPRRHA